MSVDPIRTRRLELVSMSPSFMGALLDGRREEAVSLLGAELPEGWPDEHDERFLRMRLEQMGRDPEAQQWLVRATVLPGPPRQMIGHAGFHGPPGSNGPGRPDAVEIGYSIFEGHRGQGLATETAAALVDWAHCERGIHHFVASASPDNAASLAIIRKLGFIQTGDQWDDEDGLELVFQLERN